MNPVSDNSGGLQRDPSKEGHQPVMFWYEGNGTQYLRSKFSPALDERTHELVPRRSVDPKGIPGFAEVTLQHHGRAVVKRMRHSGGRVNPL
jgi:hypothetical protein